MQNAGIKDVPAGAERWCSVLSSVELKDIPKEKIEAMGRLLLEAAMEWYSQPENMAQYESYCQQQAQQASWKDG